MNKTYPICGCPEPGCRCRGFVGDEPRALCSTKVPCLYQLRAHMPMKTRAEELKVLIAETKAEIESWTEELTSTVTTQNNIDRAKQFLAKAIETRVKLEVELSKIGG